jgi:hypothetical protein
MFMFCKSYDYKHKETYYKQKIAYRKQATNMAAKLPYNRMFTFYAILEFCK